MSQPTGANTILEVIVGDISITIMQTGFITLPEKSKLWINFEADMLNFFDAETQMNLRNQMV
jgi:hypothetical protein